MLIAGIDDAGRGPVIGPLVVAGVLFRNTQMKKLHGLGVRDSKTLTPKQRGSLYPEIMRLALKCEVVELSPLEVDRIVFEGKKLRKLNWLEAKAMAEVIEKLKPEKVYVDASDVIEERFAQQIYEMLSLNVKIISEHNADVNYPIVSAASIIAKVRRDEAISELREIYGDFGSGYCSDAKTIKFLSDLIKINGTFPNFVRKSWKTIERLRKKANEEYKTPF